MVFAIVAVDLRKKKTNLFVFFTWWFAELSQIFPDWNIAEIQM